MPKIVIGDKDLNDCTQAEAFLAGADPARAIFEGGERWDYHRNCTILEAFGDRDQMAVDLAIERHADRANGGYSAPFNALRAGELMNWATRHGIVERVEGPAWRLVLRERQFELAGPENKQRAVRVRGLVGAEAVVAAKIWDRELKRRERARVKRIARIIDEAKRQIGYIVKHEPGLKLGDALAQFAIGDVDTVLGAQEYILDFMLPLCVGDANVTAEGVRKLYIDVCARQTEKAAAERRAAREAEKAALADLAAMFPKPPPPPPPPPRVPTASVERRWDRLSTYYTVTGTLEGVRAEVAYVADVPGAYMPHFDKPIEISPGVWQSKGSMSNSCD